MRRKDGPAIRDTLIWFAALVISGGLGLRILGNLGGGSVLPRLRRHLRLGLGQPLARMRPWHRIQDPVDERRGLPDRLLHDHARAEIWRWSHTRHHTDTIIVGRDPEIITPRPPDIVALLLNVFALKNTARFFPKLFLHASGKLTAEEATFVPESERPKVYRVARIWLAIFAAVVVACLVPLDPAGDVRRTAVPLRRLAGALFRRHAAYRPGRGRPRPSAELAHRLHEPDLPLPLLEHELPRRTSHVPDGALSRAAEAARGDQGGLPDRPIRAPWPPIARSSRRSRGS